MANGYIGKISALVTASTADLSRKLQGGTRDVNRFANSVQSQIAGAASSARRSFEGIFTPLQRIQRALEAGRGSLNIIDDAQVRRFQQAVSIAEQINKPLAAASRAFQGLSADVAAGLLPALLRAQDAATRVNDEIGTTGGVTASSYRVAEQAIDRAAAAFERFRQAEQIIGSAPRGRELQFDDPQLFEALQRSADARRGAAAPGVASRVGGALGDAVREVARFDDLVAQAASRISGIRLAPQVDTSQLERAQGEYQDLLVQQRRAVEELNRLSAAPPPDPGRGFVLRQQPEQTRGLGLFGRQAGSEADAAVERAQRLDAVFKALPQSARAAVGGLAGIAARVADEVATAGTGVAQLNAVLDILEGRLSTSSAAAAAQAERVRQSGEAAREAAAKLTSLATAIQAALGNARPTVDSLEQDFRRLLEVVQKSPAGRTAFKPILDELLELFTAARNGADNLDQIIAKLNQLRAAGARGASGGLTILSDADVQADKAKQAARTIQQARDALSQRILGGFGGAGEAGLNLGIDERQLRGIAGEFDFLQDRIAGVSAETRGPLVAAMEQYRQVVNRAFKDGTISTRQGQKAIADARDEVVRLAAAQLKVAPGKLAGQLKQVGDVSRGSFGNASLAIQQAAFAIDDFFSVTGGLDQRIRAAGNNISQLGFIVGGTAGLIAGISVSIASQLIVALIKWQNAGTDTEDRVKSLNDSLARQKSLVESLAEAYRSVGESIEAAGFSDSTRQRRERERTVESLRRDQDEQLRERVAGLDPAVQRERGIQAARQRELEAADEVGERVRLQREIQASRDREREAANAAFNRPAITAEQAVQGVADSVFRAEAAAIEDRARRAAGVGPTSGESAEQQRQQGLAAAERRRQEFLATGLGRVRGAGDARSQAAEAGRIIDEAQSEIASSITTGIVGFFDGANSARRQELARLEEQRAQLEKDIFRSATNEVAIEATKTAIEASSAIGAAIEVLAEAIGGQSSVVRNELERLTQTIVEAEAALAKAQETGNVDAAEAAKAQIDAANQQKEAAISAANSVAAFAAVLDRVSNQLADTVAGEARGRADQARREDNRQRGLAEAGLGFPGDADAAQRQRERAEADARAAEDRRDRVRRQNDLRRELFERDAIAGQAGDEAQQAIRDRDEAQRRLDQAERAGDVAGANNARRDRDRAQGRLDRAFEASPSGRAAAARADELDRQEAVRREQEDSIARGRELGRSPAERAGRELAQGLRDLESAFDDNVEGILGRAGGRPQDAQADLDAARADFEADRRRLIEDSFRSAAPAIFGLADAVANSVLQGPSRAALEATDVSTVEGSRELNRLLRGDDSARDQNLVELQKQSEILTDMLQEIRQGGADVAN